MAGTALEQLRTRVLTAAAGPWSNLSERLTNASLLAEFYLWEVSIEDAVYLEMIGIYDEINELRSFIFVRQPRSLTGCLSGLRSLRRTQAAVPIIEERLMACAERCAQTLSGRRRSPYLPEIVDANED